MKTLTTITGRELKISSNQRERTFRIKTNSATYKTLPFPKDEFYRAERDWTGNDWQQFLKTDDYYPVR